MRGNLLGGVAVASQTAVVDMTVWVDDWQMDCCGEPFSVGSQVSWTIGRESSDWLRRILGENTDVKIDAFEDRHVGLPEGTLPTRGTVTAIKAAYCRYAARPGDERTRYPVSGSGVLVPLTQAGRFQEDRGELQFMGYVVQLAVPDA